ncbi:hypothetical protein SSX86_031094 [Deinandra increscens subsp. villosa]|uniref:Uncharacterized protein n=1 Tax=Deinandra increscens subsp. villosa TaxID=3103831 RepID=A0AAP0C9L5_9ASTR
MSEVVTELEVALETQEFSEWKPLFDYQGMNKTAEPPVNYSSNGELRKLLSKGVLLNGGKTCFSLNKKGEHCEMISFAECLDLGPSEFERCPWASQYNSRFAVGAYPYKNLRDEIHEETNPDGDSRCVQCSLITYAVNHVSKVVLPKKVPRRHSEPWILKTRVKTQFLSPGITYGVNLVFKFMHPRDTKKGRVLITLKYRLQGETKTSISHFAVQREDGWYMAELYQLISEQRIVDHKIWFVGFFDDYEVINVEGIEFSPLEQMEHTDDKHPISNSDANWEINMPADYEDIMKWSTNSLHWTTKKEAYSVIRKGFLINDDGKKWFFLDENGKKCHMISAKGGGDFGEFDRMLPFPDSRFGEALVLAISRRYEINCKTQSQLVSSETTYAGYLVYKLPKHQSGYEAPMQVRKGQDESYVYLKHPDTPFIRPKTHKKPHNPLNRPKLKGFPQQRIDGWMEVQICDFRTTTTTTDVMPIHIFLTSSNPMMSLFGLIIEGIEFRPI